MRRMKAAATFLLVLVLAGALITWPYRETAAGGLLFAACEAALVGALADWFAVVALFRHPLGLKFIPHTAIIPNNRDRIIDSIIAIVENDWLSRDFIKAKLFDYPLIDGLAAALETENGRAGLERLFKSVIFNAIREIDPDDAAHFVQILLKDNLSEIRISPHLVEQMETSVKDLYADDLIRIMLDWAIAVTKGDDFERALKRTLTRAADDYSTRGNFLRRIGKGLGESLDIVNYDEAAETLSHRINRFLVEMRDPDNRYYHKVKTELQNLKLADPEAAAAVLSDMIKSTIAGESGLKAAVDLFTMLKAQFLSGGDQDMPVIRYLTNITIEQLNIIRRDEERKTTLELRIKTELSNLLERYHGVIGRTVREKLESLDDRGLVTSLESKVGDDLQWIRINGTVIGALVGILQYLILHLI